MALFSKRMKTEPAADAGRVEQDQTTFALIRNVTPTLLDGWLTEFGRGYLRSLALFGSDILARDDKLASVDTKRRSATARLGWDVTLFDDSPEAQAQKDALEYFLGSLTATSAIDEDEEGGVALLIRQMLHCVAYGWSVHDVVWVPGPHGLSARFRHVPLWFFEHRTTRLRYLEQSLSSTGVDLKPGEWVVTRGPGLVIPAAILWLYKHNPLRDWLIYSRRYVVPGLIGTTDAQPGSTEWSNFKTALAKFNQAWSIIKNTGATIDKIDMSAGGELPWPKLVERCDRAMAILWRGQDLSTMSSVSGEGTGASVQDDEADIILDDDIELIEDTFARKIVPFVIRYTRGHDDVRVAFNLQHPNRDNVKLELEVDKALIGWGIPRGRVDLAERYGRTLPDAGEELATPTTDATPPAPLLNTKPRDPDPDAVHEALQSSARRALGEALAADLAPYTERLANALALEDDAMLTELVALYNDAPLLLEAIAADPAAEPVIAETITAALVNGVAETVAEHEGAV